jgi:hypothetical protein
VKLKGGCSQSASGQPKTFVSCRIAAPFRFVEASLKEIIHSQATDVLTILRRIGKPLVKALIEARHRNEIACRSEGQANLRHIQKMSLTELPAAECLLRLIRPRSTIDENYQRSLDCFSFVECEKYNILDTHASIWINLPHLHDGNNSGSEIFIPIFMPILKK